MRPTTIADAPQATLVGLDLRIASGGQTKGYDFARQALEAADDDPAVLSNATRAAAYFAEMGSRSMSPTCRSSCCCNER